MCTLKTHNQSLFPSSLLLPCPFFLSLSFLLSLLVYFLIFSLSRYISFPLSIISEQRIFFRKSMRNFCSHFALSSILLHPNDVINANILATNLQCVAFALTGRITRLCHRRNCSSLKYESRKSIVTSKKKKVGMLFLLPPPFYVNN